LVGTTADFRVFGLCPSLQSNHLLCENRRTAGRIGEDGLAISGLFDLEPIRLCYLIEKLGLDAEEARRNSPLLNLPARAAKFIITYGADELPELKRQSREFAAAWSARGLPGNMIEVPDCHHYAVLEQLAQPDGLLVKARTSVAADYDL
jgi:arylformamidase